MNKLSEILSGYDSLFEELNFYGLQLNFDHYMEIRRGNEECIFSFYWLMSYNATGHAHIVLIPVIGKTIEEWPVAFYDDEHGTAEIFSSSIKKWFPAYLVYRIDAWYPVYLSSGTQYEWVKETYENWFECKQQIVDHGKKFMKDFELFYNYFLNMIKNKSQWNILDWIKKVESDSFLTEYYSLKASESSLEERKKFIFKYSYFNRLLFEELNTEAVRLEEEDDSLDIELCMEFWNRFWKTDLEYYEVLPAVVKRLVKSPPNIYFPYMEFVKRIYEVTKDNKYGYYHGQEGMLKMGKIFEEKKEYARAIRCYENSILLGGAETEEFNEEAYDRILECADKLGDKNYLAYLEDTKEE
jgi:hypothetical protein